MSKPLLLLYLFTLLSGFVNADQTDQRMWTVPTRLSNQGENAYDPEIGFDKNGNAIVVWINNQINKKKVLSSFFQKDNETWTPPVQVSDECEQINSLKLIVNKAHDAIAVWQKLDKNQASIQASFYSNEKKTWGKVATLSHSDSSAYYPSVALDDKGNSIVVWNVIDGVGKLTIQQTSFKKHTDSWTTPVKLGTTHEKTSDIPSAIAMNSQGNALVIWVDDELVQSAYFNNQNQTWTFANITEPIKEYSFSLQVCLDEKNNGTVIWVQKDQYGFSRLHTARYSQIQEGWGWLPETLVNYGAWPNLVMNKHGNASLIWRKQDLTDGIIMVKSYDETIHEWLPVHTLTKQTAVDSPRIAIDNNGNSVAVWLEVINGKYTPMASNYNRSDDSWTNPYRLNLSKNFVSSLRLSCNGSGILGCVWTELGENSFVAARFSKMITVPSPPLQEQFNFNLNVDDLVSNKTFLGFGVQCDPYENPNLITKSDWDLIFKRLDFMKPGLMRMVLNVGWYYTGKETYQWDSVQMKAAYKLLEYAQTHNIDVCLGHWRPPNDLKSYDKKLAQIYGDLIDYLKNNKNFSCIKLFNIENELNVNNGVFYFYSKSVKNFYEEFLKRKLIPPIKIAAPDSAFFHNSLIIDPWLKLSVEELYNEIGIYEMHSYPYLTDIHERNLEVYLRQLCSYVNNHDPHANEKHFILGELGVLEGKKNIPDTQPNRYYYDYGTWIADASIQTLRAGLTGCIFFCLDDAMHFNSEGKAKGWGFWNSLGGKEGYSEWERSLRPFFYPVSLLTRFFPKNSKVLALPYYQPLRAVGVKFQEDNKEHLSFAFFNYSSNEQHIRLSLKNSLAQEDFKVFHYFENERPVDKNGFPTPVYEIKNADLKEGVSIKIAPRGFVLLTTNDQRNKK